MISERIANINAEKALDAELFAERATDTAPYIVNESGKIKKSDFFSRNLLRQNSAAESAINIIAKSAIGMLSV